MSYACFIVKDHNDALIVQNNKGLFPYKTNLFVIRFFSTLVCFARGDYHCMNFVK